MVPVSSGPPAPDPDTRGEWWRLGALLLARAAGLGTLALKMQALTEALHGVRTLTALDVQESATASSRAERAGRDLADRDRA